LSGSTTDTALYRPSGGTNPNENDSMLDGQPAGFARSHRGDRGGGGDRDKDPIMEPQPDPGIIPGEPDEGGEPLQDPFYFVCASNVKYTSPPGPDVKQLEATDPLDNFLSTFHQKGLILAATPEPTK